MAENEPEASSYYKELPLQVVVDDVLAGLDRTIETAEGLPAAAYTSRSFFNLEVEKIFKKEWICVGHLSQVPNVGDYYTVDLLDDLLVVVRGHDRVRVMSRVCLHRWASVVSGAGNAKLFICPFHGWTYNLEGELKAAPFMHEAKEFNSPACHLPEMRTEIVEELGLIFVTSSATIGSIRPQISDLIERVQPYRLNETIGVKPRFQDVHFNWKIMIETGQECYHHFAAHKETLEPRRPSRLSWCEEGPPKWTVCHSSLKAELPQIQGGMGLPNFRGLSEDALRTVSYYHLFPLTRIFLRPDRVMLVCVYPVGPMRTKATTLSLVAPDVAAQADLIEEKFAIETSRNAPQNKEDMAIDTMQQRGAMSSFARSGRLSHLEATVWSLGQYVRRQIAAP